MDESVAMEKTFSQWKQQRGRRLDVSKKGSVDAEIVHVVSLLNGCQQFFSTSSCSGRIILIDAAAEDSEVHKHNCVWLFVSHQKCKSSDLASGLSRSTGDAVLKFEPFVLHVQCRRLQDAQLLHSVAVNSGFRNSGITISKTGKIIMAVRSTHGLEAPLTHQGRLLVGHEYIDFLIQLANQKMEENLRRIQRFYQNLQSALLKEKQQKVQIPDAPNVPQPLNPASPDRLKTDEDEGEERKQTSMYKRRRKREKQQQRDNDCYHGDRDSSSPELDCLGLFT
ncbi:hypothetical protein LDENG_00128580 [Lucifuga dentata]|nr:hypothetical protein LDENG_00128580 [Lucifuga dentata]